MKTQIALALAIVTALGESAFADKKEKADELFTKAKKLMADKKYADACPKFEESYKLDPGIGGQLNIAKCYEEWGKLGRAYRAYQEAERQAKQGNDSREAKIHEIVTQLEPQVPRLMIHVPADADTEGLRLTIDGVTVDKAQLVDAQLVDPGPKQVEYQLPSGPKKSKTVPVERGGVSEITLDLPKGAPKPKQDVAEKPHHTHEAAQPDPGRSQRIAGIVIGSAGLVAVGVSSVLTLSARSKYKDALSKDCNNMTNDCDPQGLSDTHDARHEANIATFVFSVGLAAVAGGVIVYLIAPKGSGSSTSHESQDEAWYLAPTVSPTGGGFVFGGHL